MTVRLLTGDCRSVLATLPDASVQMCVTSPPYFGLRDYGVIGQIGLESTVEVYVTELVAVFREVRRVLRDDGVLFLNLGDSYTSGGRKSRDPGQSKIHPAYVGEENDGVRSWRPDTPSGLKEKDLIGIPWRVAFALQADGWYLRSDIIWAKPNPMPESVRDRPTKAHEYIFLLTKQPRYFWDAEAVREPHTTADRPGLRVSYPAGSASNHDLEDGHRIGRHGPGLPIQESGRNIRSVWTIATKPFSGSHFAVFPDSLAERCIKAGTSEKGACSACGAPWMRVVEHKSNWQERKRNGADSGSVVNGHNASHGTGMSHDLYGNVQTLGWQPTCPCDGPIAPCVVLDPFGGAGTVSLVAERLGRDSIYIDLSPTYAEMARKRIYGDAPLFAAVQCE